MLSSNPVFSRHRRIFQNILKQETESDENLVNPKTNFKRHRKLTRQAVAELPYKLQERSIQSKIPSLFKTTPEISTSAVAQSRSKIKSSLYIKVFERFNQETSKSDLNLFKGHRLAATDGSEVDAMFCTGNDENYSRSKSGGHHYFKHANCTYDVLNHTFMDCLLQPGSKKNEDAAFLELALKHKGKKIIFTCDRGYEALYTFYKLNKNKIKFIIRVKDQKSVTSMLKYYPMPDTEEYDIPYNVILTTKSSDASLIKNRGIYKYISPKNQSLFFTEDETELKLNLRVVRFWAVSEGVASLITVMTNLDPEDFSTDDIKEIYRLRWQEEIGFRTLKGSLALDSIHSRKEENIIGEIFAKLTLYNLCSRVRNALEIRKLKKKHVHKLDFGFAINLIWDNLFVSRPTRGIDDLIKKRTQPERPNRADPRKK